jgi:hypothetical protein
MQTKGVNSETDRHPPPNPRFHFVHRLPPARDWQDRGEFDDLCHWWREDRHGVCALIGAGGAGKTAIAQRFLRVLPEVMAKSEACPKDDSLLAPKSLFVFSLNQGNEEKLFMELAEWMGWQPAAESEKTPSPEQVMRLLESAEDCLLVLDNLDKAQDPGMPGGRFGKIIDSRLRAV